MNFVWRADEGETESMVLLIFVIWRYFYHWWVRVGGVKQKVLFRARWNRIFSRSDFSRSNKHGTFWHTASTGNFYEIFKSRCCFTFCPLEIYKNLSLPLSSITYIHYEISSLWKYSLRFSIFKFDLNEKHRSYFGLCD